MAESRSFGHLAWITVGTRQSLWESFLPHVDITVQQPTRKKMYIFGGLFEASLLNEIWMFAFSNVWIQIHTQGVLPMERNGHVGVTMAGFLLIFGGDAGAWGNFDRNDLWAYDYTKDFWVELTNVGQPPQRRSEFSAVVVDGLNGVQRMVIFGGAYLLNHGTNNVQRVTHNDVWEISPALPTSSSTTTPTLTLPQDSPPTLVPPSAAATSAVSPTLIVVLSVCGLVLIVVPTLFYARARSRKIPIQPTKLQAVQQADSSPSNQDSVVLDSFAFPANEQVRAPAPDYDVQLLKTERFEFSSVVLGKGSYGAVHMGIDYVTGKPVALKILKDDQHTADANQVELAVLGQLEHPNIVEFLDSWKQGDWIVIAQEHCAGGSLYDMLMKFDHLSVYLCQRYLQQSLMGLAYFHSKQLVHNDIKPHNIFLDHKGICKLGDFGTVTATGKVSTVLVGTPLYMAPEMGVGMVHTAAIDIWAIGMTVLHIILGYHPLRTCKVVRNRAQITFPISIPDTLPENLRQMLAWCFHEDAGQRPTTDQLLEHDFFAHTLSYEQETIDVNTGLLEVITNHTAMATLVMQELASASHTEQ
eukprot:NODE_427_length_2257_cov_23.966197_g398_i0.p1 GENE.NODE_427_length_2257_cov_23.966197_g398_i0~~NODE_427_length_2257_cov_23.966197_g398_i0.p1  ORF type:complete len:584 (-),score=119.94 NODE_427_length_2257_cov_23.966197_g398_i0:17-1768(-)